MWVLKRDLVNDLRKGYNDIGYSIMKFRLAVNITFTWARKPRTSIRTIQILTLTGMCAVVGHQG